MAVDKITPTDSRISHEYATLNGRKYHYLLSVPEGGKYKATIFLIHGWPDLSFAWRYQIPFLRSLGLRVVAPDMMGYGGTDAPKTPSESIHLYGFKRAADDIAELAKLLDAPRIILGGHDWGGMIVYRAAQWYPDLITHVFSVCTPFIPPSEKFFSTQTLVDGPLPQFGYQLQLAGPEVESAVNSPEKIRHFLSGVYGGKVEGGSPFMKPETGFDLESLDKIGMTPLLSEEELEYYVQQYSRSGMHGPLCWYRTREANFEDEHKLSVRTVNQPVLFILATRDNVLTPEMSAGMEAHVPKMIRREVPATHWALWQKPAEVNGFIQEWLENVVFGPKSTL